MANTIITNSDIAKHILMHFINACQFAYAANREYQDEFRAVNGFKRGNNIRILRPTYFVPREGAQMSISSIQERETFLNLAYQDGQDIALTSQQLTLQMTDLSERVLKPIAIGLANLVDRRVAQEVDISCYNLFGGAGSSLNSFASFNVMKNQLDKLGVVGDYRCIVNPNDGSALRNALQNNFNTTLNSEISIKGRLGELDGVEVLQSNNVSIHTNGVAAGTPLVDGASQTGSTLNTKGWTAGTTINQGDVFYISSGTGVYTVNPVGRNQIGTTTNDLQRFRVTRGGTADGGGLLAISIEPEITLTGPYQTVTASPSDNAAITWVGGAAGIINKNFMFSREAISLAIVPLEISPGMVNASVMTDKDTGISMRVIDAYDPQTDNSIKRVDILYGMRSFGQYMTGYSTTV